MSDSRNPNKEEAVNALNIAVKNNDTATVGLLLENKEISKIFDDAKNPVYKTPIQNNNLAMIDLLVQSGARLEIFLYYAIYEDQLSIAKFLIEKGVNLKSIIPTFDFNRNLVDLAFYFERPSIIELFFEVKPELFTIEKVKAGISMGVSNQRFPQVNLLILILKKMLLEQDGNLEQLPDCINPASALKDAALSNNLKIVQLIYECRLPKITELELDKAAQVSIRLGFTEISTFLISKFNSFPDHKESLLKNAALKALESLNYPVIDLLVEEGVRLESLSNSLLIKILPHLNVNIVKLVKPSEQKPMECSLTDLRLEQEDFAKLIAFLTNKLQVATAGILNLPSGRLIANLPTFIFIQNAQVLGLLCRGIKLDQQYELGIVDSNGKTKILTQISFTEILIALEKIGLIKNLFQSNKLLFGETVANDTQDYLNFKHMEVNVSSLIYDVRSLIENLAPIKKNDTQFAMLDEFDCGFYRIILPLTNNQMMKKLILYYRSTSKELVNSGNIVVEIVKPNNEKQIFKLNYTFTTFSAIKQILISQGAILDFANAHRGEKTLALNEWDALQAYDGKVEQAYKQIHQGILDHVKSFINQDFDGFYYNFIFLGCGVGGEVQLVADYLQNNNKQFRVLGVDQSAKNIQIAKTNEKENVFFECGNAEDIEKIAIARGFLDKPEPEKPMVTIVIASGFCTRMVISPENAYRCLKAVGAFADIFIVTGITHNVINRRDAKKSGFSTIKQKTIKISEKNSVTLDHYSFDLTNKVNHILAELKFQANQPKKVIDLTDFARPLEVIQELDRHDSGIFKQSVIIQINNAYLKKSDLDLLVQFIQQHASFVQLVANGDEKWFGILGLKLQNKNLEKNLLKKPIILPPMNALNSNSGERPYAISPKFKARVEAKIEEIKLQK